MAVRPLLKHIGTTELTSSTKSSLFELSYLHVKPKVSINLIKTFIVRNILNILSTE